jgi:hypothetical protein
LKIKVTVFDVTVQENLTDAFALISRRVEALLLRKPNWRVRRSNAENVWIIHWPPADCCKGSVFPS